MARQVGSDFKPVKAFLLLHMVPADLIGDLYKDLISDLSKRSAGIKQGARKAQKCLAEAPGGHPSCPIVLRATYFAMLHCFYQAILRFCPLVGNRPVSEVPNLSLRGEPDVRE